MIRRDLASAGDDYTIRKITDPDGPARERLFARRERIAAWFDRRATRAPRALRRWLRLSEVADDLARTPRSIAIDPMVRSDAIKRLKAAVAAGEFRVLSWLPKPFDALWLPRKGAAEATLEEFAKLVDAGQLWIWHNDIASWLEREGIEHPQALRLASQWCARSCVTEPPRVAEAPQAPDNPGGNLLLPRQEPKGRETLRVWLALRRMHPDHRVPPISRQELADRITKSEGIITSREAVERALGLRK